MSDSHSRAREDLKRCQQRLNGVLADYQDVVPRQEFEQLEEKANVQLQKLFLNKFLRVP